MVEKFETSKEANFSFNAINKNMVLGDDFENLVACYLKKMKLNPKCIKNYLIKGGVYLFDIKNKNKPNKVVRSGSIIDIDIVRCGENLIFGDDETDIICNWNEYFVLIQCKYRTPCNTCKMINKKCKHVYSKSNIRNDAKKLDKKLDEYKKGLVFGIFVINDEINIDYFDDEEYEFENIIKVINFNTNKFFNIINETGNRFLLKYLKKEKKNYKKKEKNNDYMDYEYTNNETEIIYSKFENLMKENINNFSNNFFQIMRLVLNFVRDNEENNIDNTISKFNDLRV
jgi:hypothetical protein